MYKWPRCTLWSSVEEREQGSISSCLRSDHKMASPRSVCSPHLWDQESILTVMGPARPLLLPWLGAQLESKTKPPKGYKGHWVQTRVCNTIVTQISHWSCLPLMKPSRLFSIAPLEKAFMDSLTQSKHILSITWMNVFACLNCSVVPGLFLLICNQEAGWRRTALPPSLCSLGPAGEDNSLHLQRK